jgi:sugar phosphate isomerase/epimerase
MNNSSRRYFLKAGGSAVLGTMFSRSLLASITGKTAINNFGLQLWSIARMMQDDPLKGLRLLRDNGYKEVELFGPYPFSSQKDKDTWNSITPLLGFSGSGFFGRTAKEFRTMLDDHNLQSPAMHVGLDTLRNNMQQTAEAAEILGQKYVGIAAIPENERKSPDDYKRLADDFNKIGENAKKNGVRFYYHNHGYGLKEVNGKIPFNTILENTDPELVFLEMDVFWTVAGGADAIKYLNENKGRYKLMHVKDMKQQARFSGDGSNPQQWIELFPHITDAGSGVLNLREILAAAKAAGVDHFILENDVMTNPEDSLKKGAAFMNSVA